MINLEIEKGMYVRFNGFISKIGHINTSKKGNTYVQFKQPNGLLAHTRIENIDRASFNLIDLIKVGDYVNGYKVEEVNNNLNEHKGICNCLDTYLWCVNELDEFEEIVIFENDIKSVVTKEQFNSMKYVVERDK